MVMPWVGARKGSPEIGNRDPRISPRLQAHADERVMVDPGPGMSSGMVLVCAGIVVAGTRIHVDRFVDLLAVSREHRPAGW